MFTLEQLRKLNAEFSKPKLENSSTSSTTLTTSSGDSHKSDIETREHDMVQIIPGLFVGSLRDAKDIKLLESCSIGLVISIAKENLSSDVIKFYKHNNIALVIVPQFDAEKNNVVETFDKAYDEIEKAMLSGTRVLVCCENGTSKAPGLVLYYIIKLMYDSALEKLPVKLLPEAYLYMKYIHPNMRPLNCFLKAVSAAEGEWFDSQ